jgi:transposase-like protein
MPPVVFGRGPLTHLLRACLLLLSLSLAGPLAAGPRRVELTVIPGDTPWELARRLGVSVDQLKKWNPRAMKGGVLRPGAILSAWPTVPVRPRRKAVCVVEAGDSWARIARRTGATTSHLLAVNGLARGARLKAGMRLEYYREGPEADSRAVGLPNSGRLVDGERLEPGPGYGIKEADEVWGTNETLNTLLGCVAEYRRTYPGGPDVLIGDISLKGGGPFSPHKSHENGLDVDLGYVQVGVPEAEKRFVTVGRKTLDLARTWTFLRCLIASDRVSRVFMDAPMQGWLREALANKHLPAAGLPLDRLFQVKSRTPERAIIQAASGHGDHYHVRFACDAADPDCVNPPHQDAVKD